MYVRMYLYTKVYFNIIMYYILQIQDIALRDRNENSPRLD